MSIISLPVRRSLRNSALLILAPVLAAGLVVAVLGRSSSTTFPIRNASPSALAATPVCKPCQQSLGTEPTVLKLMAGYTYQMQVDPFSGLASGGTWDCQYGTIDPSGHYTVPNYTPPYHQDRVSYTDPTGASAHMDIYVKPDPDVASTGYPRYIVYATGAKGAPSYETNPASQLIGNNGTVLASDTLMNLVAGYPTIPVVEGSYPAEFEAEPVLTDCEDIPVAVEVPVEPGLQARRTSGVVDEQAQTATETMLVVNTASTPQKAKPQKCKPQRTLPPPPFWYLDCSGNPNAVLYVDGTPVLTGPTPVPPLQTASIEFTAGIKANLDAAGLGGLGIGFDIGATYSMTRQILQYKETKRREKYCCKNGLLQFCAVEQCTRSGQGEWVVPKWVAFVDGYPANGDPDPDTWTSWNCK